MPAVQKKSWASLRLFLSLMVTLGLVTGCGSNQIAVNPEVQHKIRANLIRETAMSYASKYALHWESIQINKHLQSNAKTLDHIYNFRPLLLANQLIPPILIETKQNVQTDNPNLIRMSDRSISIHAPARFSTAIPSWKSYLFQHYPLPDRPVSALLPRNQAELKVWNEAIKIGWRAGRQQAAQIFRVNIGALSRDYRGMILYYQYLAQRMITPAHAAHANLGITGDETSMQLNDRIIKITNQSKLLPQSIEQWKPALR